MADNEDEVDLEGMRVDPELLQQGPPKVERGWRRVMTQVPRHWELTLLKAKRISTYRLGLELLYLGWHGKGAPIAVTGHLAKFVGLSDRSKWNALRELEQLKLIEIVCRTRKSPSVTLLRIPRRGEK
ncbi:hypothetical protein [Bradyrhizobium sp. I1.7.5]|uniref:hypothetical protein n=1 Tax=Bradyrhizobium sp. I1.7.5 TaxID=3156363 RepID=UPI0033942D3B